MNDELVELLAERIAWELSDPSLYEDMTDHGWNEQEYDADAWTRGKDFYRKAARNILKELAAQQYAVIRQDAPPSDADGTTHFAWPGAIIKQTS